MKIVERGVKECQQVFEILIDSLVHSEQGTFQPYFVTAEHIGAILTSQQLPDGLDYPNFPFPELQNIIVSHIYVTTNFSCMH